MTTESGDTLTHADLADARHAVVGFFSPICGPCRTQLPKFADYLASSATRGVAVIVGPAHETDQMLDQAPAGADLVRHEAFGALDTAFDVAGFPAFIEIENGRIVGTWHDVDRLASPAPARR